MVNDKHYNNILKYSSEYSFDETCFLLNILINSKTYIQQLHNYTYRPNKLPQLLQICKFLGLDKNIIWNNVRNFNNIHYCTDYPKFLVQYDKDLFEFNRCNKAYIKKYKENHIAQMGLDCLIANNYQCFKILFPNKIEIKLLHSYIYYGVRTGNILMLDYLKSEFKTMEFPSNALTYAVTCRSIKMIDYLMDNGCLYEPEITEVAGEIGDLECFKHLIKKGVCLHPYAHIVAGKCGNMDIVNFVLNNN